MSVQATELGGDGTSAIVHRVRAFNRFYMPAMNLLGDHCRGSEYPVTAARIFYEIYSNEGCNAAFIAKTMRVDKSYLSCLISRHEKNGCIKRRPSEKDGRSELSPEGETLSGDFHVQKDLD
ncbi:MAG: MarR family winged helix-turn-helix transcriptional regulator [Mesosutterella sp.]|nr:MarR family winged helix-turn-helix transcriptional regulator [Mesosutterella sp.]